MFEAIMGVLVILLVGFMGLLVLAALGSLLLLGAGYGVAGSPSPRRSRRLGVRSIHDERAASKLRRRTDRIHSSEIFISSEQNEIN